MTSLRSLRTVAGRAVALLVAGLVVLVLAAVVVVPKVVGAHSYTILTGSMEPHLPPGTVVVVRPTASEQIAIGDVVTYQLESGRSTVVTHRVRSISTSLDRERQFVTQGDANDAPDAATVRPVQLRGTVWYAVPWVGYPALVIGADVRQVVVSGAVLLLFGYALASFAGAVRDRRRERRNDTPRGRELLAS